MATGDEAFGFKAIEINTAMRHKPPVVFMVANNGAWQIEVHDQTITHGKVVGTKLSSPTTRPWRAPLACSASALALDRAFANPPALIDVAVTAEVTSADGKTGLACVATTRLG